MIIFLRLLPFLIPLLEAGLFFSQIHHPLVYPWIALIGVALFPIAATAISWSQLPFRNMCIKMAPSFLLLASCGFALLLVEGNLSLGVLIAVAGISSGISLELLFLLCHHPARYPFNGLSRVNVAYVPIALWYAASTWNGLLIFVHVNRFWYLICLTALSGVLFRTTGHTNATEEQTKIWTIVGLLVGVHVGLLGLLLPVGMPMQGIIAAFLISASLRARRYMYDPKPSTRQAYVEGGLAAVSFVSVLVTAKWL